MEWEVEIVLLQNEECSGAEGSMKAAHFVAVQFLFEWNEQVIFREYIAIYTVTLCKPLNSNFFYILTLSNSIVAKKW